MGNLERRREWLELVLTAIPKGHKILDAGAGELQNKPLCSHLDYVSQDFGEYVGGESFGLTTKSWDTSGVDIISDIADMPIDNAEFDAVLCSEVLEHVPDPVLALNEIVRVCKPGGLVIVTAPFASYTHFAPFHYCTGFNRFWYEWHFKRLGCEIVTMEANGDYFEVLSQELLRFGSMMKNKKGYLEGLMAYILSKLAIRQHKRYDKNKLGEIASFGFHVVAKKI